MTASCLLICIIAVVVTAGFVVLGNWQKRVPAMSRTRNRLRVAADESLPPLLRQQAWLSASLFPAESDEAWEQAGFVALNHEGRKP